MKRVVLTNTQARRFLLLKHGLLDRYKFSGKQGVLDFIKQAGCVQYDPIDVCGKNAELVLQSRVKGFTKKVLYSLLYEDRELVDYFDKNLAIIKTSDWAYFSRYRETYKAGGLSHNEINHVCDEIKEIIKIRGPVSSADLEFNEKVSWYWSDTKLSRAALETMYFRGDLVIHHKKGAIKYYDIAENRIPENILAQPDPHPDELSHLKWRVMRRIEAVGMLWNRPSDAWLNIKELKAAQRNQVFEQLIQENKLIEITVEGIKDKFFCLSADDELLERVKQETVLKARCELIAPLDNLLWDRKLIQAIFNFEYKWEIYTPEIQRKYGYYVLPVLYGDSFIGRIEAVRDNSSGMLNLKNIWFEKGVRQTKGLKASINSCLNRFAAFNGCSGVTGIPWSNLQS